MLNFCVENWRKMKSRKIVIEEVSRDEAKEKISDFLDKISKQIYPSKIAEQLRIDYELCVEIIEELLEEEKIEIVEDSEK